MATSRIDDPFRAARQEQGVLECDFAGERIPMILRHRDVRRAAKNWQTFSSDAPFRIPIPAEDDVRTVRQLPIEIDPPEQIEYKKIVQPFFRRPRDPKVEKQVLGLVRDAVAEALGRDSIEVVREFALPLQSHALTCLLGLPMAESEEWIGWGTHVFRDKGADSVQRGTELEAYLDRQIDRAMDNPDGDFFSALVQAEYRGRKLTREEIMGYANLAFAGGRDTIISFVSSAIAYLSDQPEALAKIRGNPKLAVSATEEFVRYFSPLTHIGRVCPHGADVHGSRVGRGERASLCWASANRDEQVFEAADQVRLDRRPNPHVGFGFGAHACLGAPQARLIMRGLLSELATRVGEIRILEARPNLEVTDQFTRQVGFERLLAAFDPLR